FIAYGPVEFASGKQFVERVSGKTVKAKDGRRQHMNRDGILIVVLDIGEEKDLILFNRSAEGAAKLFAVKWDTVFVQLRWNAMNGIKSGEARKGRETRIAPVNVAVAVILVGAGTRNDIDGAGCRSAG